MPAPLATPEQLGNFLQQTIQANDPVALQLLSMTSALIRRYLDMEVTQHLADVEYRTPLSGQRVYLREAPVTNVSMVEVRNPWTGLWTTANPTDYNVSLQRGEIWRSYLNNTGINWPTDDDSWRITYDHGFTTIPDDIAGVCVSSAARFYATPSGIDAERVGQRQVKYSLTADDFNTIERLVLDSYKWPRIA